MKPMVLVLCAALAGTQLSAQAPSARTITFTYDNPGLQPPHYVEMIHEDGTGTFESTVGNNAAPTDRAAPRSLARPIKVADPLLHQLFQSAQRNHFFATPCSLKHSNLAFTGNKTFAYAGPDGQGSCTFNYAKDQQLQALAGRLIAIATTLAEGANLELLLSHDKLGLEAAMTRLTSEQEEGLVGELENIAPILQAIANDGEVLHHTQAQATALLKTISQ